MTLYKNISKLIKGYKHWQDTSASVFKKVALLLSRMFIIIGYYYYFRVRQIISVAQFIIVYFLLLSFNYGIYFKVMGVTISQPIFNSSAGVRS